MPKKNPSAVALGRLGGLKKVPKGAAMLSPEERTERAKKAVNARWNKEKAAKKSVAKAVKKQPR